MKKLVLLSLTACVSAAAFGQRAKITSAQQSTVNIPYVSAAAKTTAPRDTVSLPLLTTADTLTLFYTDMSPHDSGWTTGMDAWGDKGFAQRYDVKASDSSFKVLGLITKFGGSVAPGSSNSVNLKIWSQGAQTVWFTGRPTLLNSGFPDVVQASRTVSVNSLGIGATSADPDTTKLFWFTTPSPVLTQNFFAGYDMTYTWGSTGGDTIALYSTRWGNRTAVAYTVSGGDTIINNYNAAQYSDGTWHDNYFGNFQIPNKLVAIPVVHTYRTSLSVPSITNNGFTFHGNYPNPATNATNISFALAVKTDVNISVMDMNGRVVKTMNQAGLSTGEHTVVLETANLAAGDYVYVIMTANGGNIASKFTVIK